ncbi:adenosine deaminase, partial [Vibrio parahaemolyticus]|nr:adenosine deaminase [Vibrio parahaemolyticus]
NYQTSTVETLENHPLKQFLEHGVLACLNTDDPAVEGIELPYEYEVAAPAAGLSQDQIRQAQINGLEIAFLSEAEKSELREKVKDRA